MIINAALLTDLKAACQKKYAPLSHHHKWDGSYIHAPSQLKAHTKAFPIIKGAMDELLSRIEQPVTQAQ